MGKHYFNRLVDGLLNVAIPTFGQIVEYRPLSGGRFRLKAVFDTEFTQILPNTEQVVSVNRPHIGCKLIDIPAEPLQGDTVRVEGDYFFVSEIQEDGQGGVLLWLTKQNEQET